MFYLRASFRCLLYITLLCGTDASAQRARRITSASESISVSMLIRPSGSIGAEVTTNMLAATSVGGTGSFLISAKAITNFPVIDANFARFRNPIRVNGVGAYDGNDQSMRFPLLTNSSTLSFAYAGKMLSTTRNKRTSAGAFIRTDVTLADAGVYDPLVLNGSASGCSSIAQFVASSGSTYGIRAHTTLPTTYGSSVLLPQTGWTVWCTVLYDATNLTCTVHVYDPVSWNLIGVSSCALADDHNGRITFGNGEVGFKAGKSIWIQSLIIDVDNARFPLLP